jgi:hypothetical protein
VIRDFGYSIDSTYHKVLWLLWQLDLKTQTAIRAFVALHFAAGPSRL